jgi:hypothetical protein
MQTEYENKTASSQPSPKFTRVDIKLNGIGFGYFPGRSRGGLKDQVRQFCEYSFGKGELIKLGNRSYEWVQHGADKQAVCDKAADGSPG